MDTRCWHLKTAGITPVVGFFDPFSRSLLLLLAIIIRILLLHSIIDGDVIFEMYVLI